MRCTDLTKVTKRIIVLKMNTVTEAARVTKVTSLTKIVR